MAVNSLNKPLPRACKLVGITPRGNHGVRASMVQRLRGAKEPDDQNIQITGHWSVWTLAVHDINQLNPNVHKKFQEILQNIPTATCNSNDKVATSSNPLALAPQNLPSTSNLQFTPNQSVANLAICQNNITGTMLSNCTFNLGTMKEDSDN